MNEIIKKIIALLVILTSTIQINCNNNENIRQFTLEEVVELAKKQSFEAILARHRFRESFWEYKTYQANFLPLLSLNADIFNFNRAIKKYQKEDGSYTYIEDFANGSSLGLSISQNIGLTGGNIFINSELERNNDFSNNSINYLSTPISIGFRQPLNGYNQFHWQNKIEPLKYEEAKKEYIQAMEEVSKRAIDYFFNLALAQINVNVSKINYANTDTLYKIAQGRYNIGTISEDELLQMELSFLNAELALNQVKVEHEMYKARLRSFLGYNENIYFELIISTNIPNLEIDPFEAFEIAKENNPQMIAFKRRRLEADRDVAHARSQKGFNADLYASLGLTQNALDIPGVYAKPQNQQRISVGLQVPILDWGLGRGKYKMAQSAREVIHVSVEQNEIDFKYELLNNVMRFNLQDDQVLIASKADTIADYRYYVAKQRFLIGNIGVLELNIALKEKDDAKRAFIQSLKNYWQYFYDIRSLTLYDFENNIKIEDNLDIIY
ncbi:MAG: TolC family protein [Bacteroidales bacterium]|nr:TolC family protein [Bacteroidales bacterium]